MKKIKFSIAGLGLQNYTLGDIYLTARHRHAAMSKVITHHNNYHTTITFSYNFFALNYRYNRKSGVYEYVGGDANRDTLLKDANDCCIAIVCTSTGECIK